MTITVSKKGLSLREPLELIKLSYLLNKEKFKNEFDKVKVKIQDSNVVEDLNNLANIAKSKLDVSGRMKENTPDGSVIMFDTMRILNGVKYTQAEKDAVLSNQSNFTE